MVLLTGRRFQSGNCYEGAALDQVPRPGDLTYRLPLPPSGPQWTVQGPGPVGRVVGLTTTFGPVWIGMEPRPDLVGVTATFPPTWTFPGFPPEVALFAHALRTFSHLLKQAFLQNASLVPAQLIWQALKSAPHCAKVLAAEAVSAVRAADARAANKISDFRMIVLPIS
jgi:hypothetical protein